MDFSNPNVEVVKKDEPNKESNLETNLETNELSVEEIDKWMDESINLDSQFCCLITGTDGTGKSGLALSYLTDEDIKNDICCIIVDLDDGNKPLISMNHKEKCDKYNKEWQKVYRVVNPQMHKIVNGNIEIDYQRTIAKIRGVINWARAKQKEYKIKFIIFDGLSKALKYCEYFMRMEKSIMPDGGIATRFWLIRNKMFLETLDLIKALPMSKFFIGHENFVLKTDGENSSVIEITNAMMHQKIHCKRENDFKGIKFVARIDKSKYKVVEEGKEYIICEVKEGKASEWKGYEVLKNLL